MDKYQEWADVLHEHERRWDEKVSYFDGDAWQAVPKAKCHYCREQTISAGDQCANCGAPN